MAKMTKQEARNKARNHGISFLVNFHTLSSSKVDFLLGLADEMGYRRPKNAPGSRGRSFFYYLQSGRGGR